MPSCLTLCERKSASKSEYLQDTHLNVELYILRLNVLRGDWEWRLAPLYKVDRVRFNWNRQIHFQHGLFIRRTCKTYTTFLVELCGGMEIWARKNPLNSGTDPRKGTGHHLAIQSIHNSFSVHDSAWLHSGMSSGEAFVKENTSV